MRRSGNSYPNALKGSVGGRAPPLTPSELKRGLYDEPGLIDTLKTGFTPGDDALGGEMAAVVKDSTSQYTDDDRKAVAAYLLGLEQ